MKHENAIYIKGARVHNLRNIEVEIPHDKLVVITGLSGSGKSTLAFDTIFAEGQRRYVESLSAYARQFLGKINKPDVDIITGIAPAIAIEQKVNTRNPRSTVGTTTEIYDYLKLLYARIGHTFSPVSGQEVRCFSVDDVAAWILAHADQRVVIGAPLALAEGQGIIEKLTLLLSEGLMRVYMGGEVKLIEDVLPGIGPDTGPRRNQNGDRPHARRRRTRIRRPASATRWPAPSPTAGASARSSRTRASGSSRRASRPTASSSNTPRNTCSASTTRWGPAPGARGTAR